MQPYYQDAQVTLYHGDVLDVVDAVTSFDALIADPPYSSGGQFRGDRVNSTWSKYLQDRVDGSRLPEFTGDNRDQRVFLVWARLWLEGLRLKASQGTPCLLFIDWRQLPALTDAMQLAGWVWSGIGAWNKTNGRPQTVHFAHDLEYVVHGRNGAAPTDYKYYPRGMFDIQSPRDGKEHMAQKPLPVMQWLVQFCAPGGTVFDPFMGSGSTIEAARNCGYRAIGSDIDEYWCEVAANRLSQQVLI